jgi:hypothetical protein
LWSGMKMTKRTSSHHCYCNERKTNPAIAESMKDIPDGFCGICEICGKPGHTKTHPHLPTTGSWCDEHWHELISHRIVNIPQLLFRFVIVAFVLAGAYFARDIIAEFPLKIFSTFYSNKCSEQHFEGKSPIADAIFQHIKRECLVARNDEKLCLNLKDFTPFKWDTVTVIKPYTMKMDVVRRIGLDGKVLACSKNGLYDQWTQLVFQSDGETVAFFDISSYLLSFGNRKEYSFEDAQIPFFCLGAGMSSSQE